MIVGQDRLLDRCVAALTAHLDGEGEAALHSAYELGREAMAAGLGVLDMTTIAHDSLVHVIRDRSDRRDLLERALPFLLECYSPFAMAHRGASEANSALRRVNEVREEEVRRLARELHDQAAQLLAAVHLSLERMATCLTPQGHERLQEVRLQLREVEVQLRRISHEMRPTLLDDLGLVPALSFLCDGASSRGGFRARVAGKLDRSLATTVETALYRAAQEALNNVARHARASEVVLTVRQDGSGVTLRIADDGVGFDTRTLAHPGAQAGLGLAGIRERIVPLGGTLQVHSEPGRGTEIRIAIPRAGREHASHPAG